MNKVLNKDDKPKVEFDLVKDDENPEEEIIRQRKNNNNNKNLQIRSNNKKLETQKSSSSKGVVEIKSTLKKSREFNLSTSVKKNGLGTTNSNGKVKK